MEAELILAAIQAALKLYAGIRKAFVDATRDRPLLLPLPRAPELTIEMVLDWFVNDDQGREITAAQLRIQQLIKPGRSVADRDELFQLYAVYSAEVNPPINGTGDRPPISGEDLSALLQVRQWAKSEDPGHQPILQEIAGTVINIAVDYYANTPGAVSDKRPEGKMLLAFLKALNRQDFANTPVGDIAGDLLVGALGAVSATPTIVRGGEKEQLLVSHIASAMAEAAARHLKDKDTDQVKDAGGWLQVAMAAVVRGAADTVLQNPSLFFGVKHGADTNVLQAVSGSVADLVIGPDSINLQPLLSAQGVETVAHALLAAVASNPDVIGVNNAGVTQLVTDVAKALAASKLASAKDLGPEVVKLVLERTAANLDLIWPNKSQDPGQNILVQATKQTLAALDTLAGTGKWTLSREQVLALIDAAFQQAVQNPAWAASRLADGNPIAQAALVAAISALQGRSTSEISAQTVQAVLTAALTAVAAQLNLLDKLPATVADAGKVFLTVVIDAVLSAIFTAPDQAKWQLARGVTVQVAIEAALAAVAKKGNADQATLDTLRAVLGDLAAGRIAIDDFAAKLAAALAPRGS